MKVNELIEKLKQFSQDIEVIMSRDSEGNRFSPLNSINQGTVHPKREGLYCEVIDSFYCDEHTDDECCLSTGERETFTKVVCIWPS